MWKTKFNGGAVPGTAIWSGGMLFFGTYDDEVFALSDSTGEICWKVSRNLGTVWSVIAVSGLEMVIFASETEVTSLDIHSGKVIWTLPGRSRIRCGSSFDPKTIYLTDTGVRAIDVQTGVTLWNQELGIDGTSRIVVSEHALFFTSRRPDRQLYAVNVADGQLLWRSGHGGDAGNVCLINSTHIVVQGSDWNIHCLKAEDGKHVWSYRIKSVNVSYLVADTDAIYVAEFSGAVSKLRSSDGYEMWRTQTVDDLNGPPTIVNNLCYVGAGIGRLITMSCSDGKVERNLNFGTLLDRLNLENRLAGACTNSPVASPTGAIFVTTTYGVALRVS